MSLQSLPAKVSVTREGRAVDKAPGAWQTLEWALQPLSSLKLTVVLFVFAILLVFIGTLAQAEQGIWSVMKNYFRSWAVLVPLQVLFPRTWFPNWQGLRGVFPFPGGVLIGTLMALNLLAAHTVRFKLQARGRQLWMGVGVLALGVLLTWLVISGGQNSEGLQGKPPFEYSTLWTLVKFSLAGLLGGAVLGTFSASPERALERNLWRIAAVVLAVLVTAAFLFGGALGDSSMRIMWQLIQGGLSSLVLLAGCLLIFQNRAGIVLLHSGILLMMFGELLVGGYAIEEQMAIDEGQTKNFCQDIRSVELAIVDRGGAKTDDVIAVPLLEKEMPTRWLKSKKIDLPFDDIPFRMEIVSFLPNSTQPRQIQANESHPATAGVGQNTIVTEARRRTGTDNEATDIAAAYVKFTNKKDGRDLGTYLVSQYWSLQDLPETLNVDGRAFDLFLRFKTNYKPYQVRLIDVRKDDYVGTDIPRNYSSDVQLVDDRHHVDYETRVWMNNPLRYAGQTFYQSGYHRDPRTGLESTTLAVVTNTGWMIPYMACMMVATGLLMHFSRALVRFLRRRAERGVAVAATSVPGQPVTAELATLNVSAKHRPARHEPSRKPPVKVVTEVRSPPSRMATVVFPAVVVCLLGGYTLSQAIPRRTANEKFEVRGFGGLPVTFEGRVKPYDTVARSSLRIISNRDYFVDNAGDSRPAMRWLLDVISHKEDAQKYRIFRIDNLEVQTTLGLEPRKHFRYAYSEFSGRMTEFRRQVKLAIEEPDDKLTTFQKKILELDKKLQLFFKLSESHRLPDPSSSAFENADLLIRLADLGNELAKSPVPYAIPTKLSDRGWEPLTTAATRLWIQDMARENAKSTVHDLAGSMAKEVLAPERIEEMTKTRILSLIASMTQSRNENLTDEEAQRQARKMYDEMPADIRDNLTRAQRERILDESPRIEANIERAMTAALGKAQLSDSPNPLARSMSTILTAYRTGDAAEFQKELVHYRELIPAAHAAELSPTRTAFEAFFNYFAPFYQCLILYVVAFVLVACGWLGWSVPLNRAALWLVLFTFVIHTLALVSRIYISGRPPVTNLYSSAVFIGWGCVVLGLVFEWLYKLGIGTIVATISGFATLLVAHLLNTEVPSHQGDTFTVMQAVLDTQFWLATHVVCITLGYSTTYLAGLLGLFYVLRGVLTPSLSPEVGKDLSRMIYGTLCFAIFFSFVGTVLGGLWADDSWGRFWGWDPKENGALIIVLWNALVLHARWDGMVKERGMAILAIVGNIVTSWSWFGVNELGVGLHSYGFTAGVLRVLGYFALSQLIAIGIGLIPKAYWWSIRRSEVSSQAVTG